MKKKILRGISLLLVFLMVLSTVACGGNSPPSGATESDDSVHISTNETVVDTESDENTVTDKVTDGSIDDGIIETEKDTEGPEDTSKPSHLCKSENSDHICDICGVTFEVCKDIDTNHSCDVRS